MGPTIKVFQQKPDDEHLHIVLGGINATLDLDMKFSALHIIPITASQVNLTNLTLEGTINFSSIDDDMVHWQMGADTNFHLDDFSLQTGGSVTQFFFNILKSLIKGAIDTALSKTLPATIDSIVTGLN